MKRGHLFLFTGTSGAGKTTIVNRLLEADPKLKRTPNYTSRPRRGNEVDGVHYHFVSKEKFEELIKEDFFIEWADVYEDYKGSPKPDIEKLLEDGHDVILLVDPLGAKNVVETGMPSTSIFIDAPDEDLKRRIKSRGTDTEEQIKTRMGDIEYDRGYKKHLEHTVMNRDGKLKETINEILDILEKTRNS